MNVEMVISQGERRKGREGIYTLEFELPTHEPTELVDAKDHEMEY